jgi:hypothetical protein
VGGGGGIKGATDCGAASDDAEQAVEEETRQGEYSFTFYSEYTYFKVIPMLNFA